MRKKWKKTPSDPCIDLSLLQQLQLIYCYRWLFLNKNSIVCIVYFELLAQAATPLQRLCQYVYTVTVVGVLYFSGIWSKLLGAAE